MPNFSNIQSPPNRVLSHAWPATTVKAEPAPTGDGANYVNSGRSAAINEMGVLLGKMEGRAKQRQLCNSVRLLQQQVQSVQQAFGPADAARSMGDGADHALATGHHQPGGTDGHEGQGVTDLLKARLHLGAELASNAGEQQRNMAEHKLANILTSLDSEQGRSALATMRDQLQEQERSLLAAVRVTADERPGAIDTYYQSVASFKGRRLMEDMVQSLRGSRLLSQSPPSLADAREAGKSQAESQAKINELVVALEPAGAQLSRVHADIGELGASAAQDGSHYDFYEQLMKLLEQLQGDWLDRNQEILGNYIAFFEKLTEVMAIYASCFNGFQDGGEQNVNFDRLWVALEDLKNSPLLDLGGSFSTRAEAEAFLKELGLEGVVVEPDGTGFKLKIDPESIKKLQDQLPLQGGSAPNPRPGQPGYDAGARNTSHTPAKINAVTAAKDAIMERFNHISRVMTEKYQRTLQLWDTLVKTLSGTIDAIAEADRSFANNLL